VAKRGLHSHQPRRSLKPYPHSEKGEDDDARGREGGEVLKKGILTSNKGKEFFTTGGGTSGLRRGEDVRLPGKKIMLRREGVCRGKDQEGFERGC